jgi:hypothetical protein
MEISDYWIARMGLFSLGYENRAGSGFAERSI